MVLSRITSRTPLREPMLSSAFHSPRKGVRQRASFIAVIALVLFSSYLFFVQRPSLSSLHSSPSSLSRSRYNGTPEQSELALTLEALRHNHHPHRQHQHVRPPVKLSKEEELAAVSSFLASLPQNVIPHFVDPSAPIDPQLVLDFDTQSPRAREEVEAMTEDVWRMNPVMLYCKLYSPVSREIKTLLEAFHLAPEPTIIDVDVRDDAAVLKPLIERLTDSDDLPVLLIGGKPVGSISDIRALHKEGRLETIIKEAGGTINGSRKKKHRR